MGASPERGVRRWLYVTGAFFLAPFIIFSFLLISDVANLACSMSNLMRPELSGLAAEKISETSPGTLDFRKLAGDYKRICILELESQTGEHFSVPGLFKQPNKHKGKHICGRWERDSVWFALIDTDSPNSSYITLQRHFSNAPSGHAKSNANRNCAPTSMAIANCKDHGWNGIRCSFIAMPQ